MYGKTGAEKRAKLRGSQTEREDLSFRRWEEKRAAEQKKEGRDRGKRKKRKHPSRLFCRGEPSQSAGLGAELLNY